MRRDQAESEGSPEAEAVERNQETDQPEGAEQPASSS
jgi:hypothetical protein